MSVDPDRLQGMLYGALLGCMFCERYERDERIDPSELVDQAPARGARGAHVGRMFVLLESLIDAGRVDPDDLRARLARVPTHYTPNSDSMLRVPALVLWHSGSDNELAVDAMVQSRITHAHPRASACCAIYALWLRRIMLGDGPHVAYQMATQQGLGCFAREERAELRAILDNDPRAVPEGSPSGSRDAADALLSTLWCAARSKSYPRALHLAASYGKTATMGVLVGAVAGWSYGLRDVPNSWIQRISPDSEHRTSRLVGKLLFAKVGEQ